MFECGLCTPSENTLVALPYSFIVNKILLSYIKLVANLVLDVSHIIVLSLDVTCAFIVYINVETLGKLTKCK